MSEVYDFFKELFKHQDFRVFGESGNWTVFHEWFYIISELMVGTAYFAIPILLFLYAIRLRKKIKLRGLYALFVAFVVICGATFFTDALLFWVPVYRFSALLQFIAGIVSWIMVLHIGKHSSLLFSLYSAEDMQAEIKNRIEVENELKQKNEQLQEAERLAKLGYIRWDVEEEQVQYSDSVPELLEVQPGQALSYQLLSAIVHKDDMKNVEKVIDTIFIKKFFPNFYCRIKTAQNEIKHLLIVGQITLSPSGGISLIKATVQDVTEQRLYIHKIQTQNERLRDIAWIQSHKVRAPVASILGLVQLFNSDQPDDPVNKEVLDGVTEAANTLDGVIKEINSKTEADNTDDTEPA